MSVIVENFQDRFPGIRISNVTKRVGEHADAAASVFLSEEDGRVDTVHLLVGLVTANGYDTRYLFEALNLSESSLTKSLTRGFSYRTELPSNPERALHPSEKLVEVLGLAAHLSRVDYSRRSLMLRPIHLLKAVVDHGENLAMGLLQTHSVDSYRRFTTLATAFDGPLAARSIRALRYIRSDIRNYREDPAHLRQYVQLLKDELIIWESALNPATSKPQLLLNIQTL